MKDIEYYDRMAKDLYNKAYSDGYSDGVRHGTYWAVHKPPVFGMDDGISDRMGGYKQYKKRMTCYGNAVVPQQFYPVFEAIAKIEELN